MAFQFSNANTPYYKPEAPELPGRVNMPQGDFVGNSIVNAFVSKAIADERAQVEQKQMMQNADLQAQKLSYDYTALDQEHDLRTRALDIQADLEKHQASHLDQLTETAKTQNKLYGTAFERSLMFEKQKSSLMLKAGATADDLHLTDPQYQTDHPMEYAKNAYIYQKKYGSTVDPQLKAAVDGFISKAEESKVTLDHVQYPWSQVVKDIAINQDKSPFVDMLKKNGFMTTVNSDETVETQAGIVPKNVTRTPKGEAKRLLEEARGVNFGELKNVKPETSAFAPKNATAAIASGTLDLGVQPRPTSSKAEVEAAHVNQLNAKDPTGAAQRRALFLSRNPGREDLLN